MAFQPAADMASLEYIWHGPNSLVWQNVLHFRKVDFTNADLDYLCLVAFNHYMGSALKANISQDVLLASIVGTDLRTQGAYQTTTLVAVSGDAGVDMVAQGSPIVATMRTALRGRSYRGRFYFSGLSETNLTDGEYLATTASSVVAFLNTLREDAEAEGWEHCILSRYANHVQRPVAIGQGVNLVEVRDLRPGSQRRRNSRG